MGLIRHILAQYFNLVGAWCKKLEVANVVSRIKQENFHTYAGTVETHQHQPGPNIVNIQVPAGPNVHQQQNPQNGVGEVPMVVPNEVHYFPGITLKFCVSDIGLQALEFGCKLLRRITMNKISNHSPAQVDF